MPFERLDHLTLVLLPSGHLGLGAARRAGQRPAFIIAGHDGFNFRSGLLAVFPCALGSDTVTDAATAEVTVADAVERRFADRAISAYRISRTRPDNGH
jgi:hypothetical protein